MALGALFFVRDRSVGALAGSCLPARLPPTRCARAALFAVRAGRRIMRAHCTRFNGPRLPPLSPITITLSIIPRKNSEETVNLLRRAYCPLAMLTMSSAGDALSTVTTTKIAFAFDDSMHLRHAYLNGLLKCRFSRISNPRQFQFS